MSTAPEHGKKQGKLKVKFVGQFRDYLQCRKTKVRVTMRPESVKDQIKYHTDTVRDLENILDVLGQVEIKEARPSVGELLASSMPGSKLGEEATYWSVADDAQKSMYQQWAEQFISVLQDELYLTESLQRGEADEYLPRKQATVKAVREILERR